MSKIKHSISLFVSILRNIYEEGSVKVRKVVK